MAVPSIVEICDKALACALQMAVLLSVQPRHILRSPECVSATNFLPHVDCSLLSESSAMSVGSLLCE